MNTLISLLTAINAYESAMNTQAVDNPQGFLVWLKDKNPESARLAEAYYV